MGLPMAAGKELLMTKKCNEITRMDDGRRYIKHDRAFMPCSHPGTWLARPLVRKLVAVPWRGMKATSPPNASNAASPSLQSCEAVTL